MLKRLPQEEDETQIGAAMMLQVIRLLKANRFDKSSVQGRKRKINVPAGQAISTNDFRNSEEEDASNNVDSPEAADSGEDMEESENDEEETGEWEWRRGE